MLKKSRIWLREGTRLFSLEWWWGRRWEWTEHFRTGAGCGSVFRLAPGHTFLGRPQPMTDWCIKAPSFQRNVGQLCRAILTPELPTGSAEAVYEACIIAWLLPQLILLPSPPVHGHSLINILLRASFLQNLSHICVRGETAYAPQSGFPSPLGAKLGIPKCEKAERAK